MKPLAPKPYIPIGMYDRELAKIDNPARKAGFIDWEAGYSSRDVPAGWNTAQAEQWVKGWWDAHTLYEHEKTRL